MKKFSTLLLATALLLQQSLFAQSLKDSLARLSKTELSNYYSAKSKRQRNAGFALTGAGLLLVVLGAGAAVSSMDLFGSPKEVDHTGDVLAILGGGLVVGSIPLYISSGVNAHRAKVILRQQSTFITPDLHPMQTHIGIAVNL